MSKTFHNWCKNPDSKTLVMGIINVTPDSFSDGGKCYSLDDAVSHASELIEEGADIVDIGGESTRPGAEQVTESEEIKRVLPVIEKLRINYPEVLISIDTTKASVADYAAKVGVDIINDISGLNQDEDMAGIVSKYNLPLVIMHMKGNPKTMQKNPKYKNIVQEIIDYFKKQIKIATKSGVNRNNIILDPGFGFGKTVDHNFELLSRLSEFKKFKLPILIGTSRKSFIGETLSLPSNERLEGTAATVAAGVLNGANIVRVHDVKKMLRVVKIIDKVRQAR